MAQQGQLDRFRSFAERYLIARAPAFRLGFEREDAFTAIQDARTMYNMVEAASHHPDMIDNVRERERMNAQMAALRAGMPNIPPGATGPAPPWAPPGVTASGPRIHEILEAAKKAGIDPKVVLDNIMGPPNTVDSKSWTG